MFSWLLGSAAAVQQEMSAVCQHSHQHLKACRIGEAAHPGPWTLATSNVNSLRNKLSHILPCQGTWAFQETCLTEVTLRQLKTAVRPVGRQIIAEPVPPRVEASHIWGQASGVAVISDVRASVCSEPLDPVLAATHRYHDVLVWPAPHVTVDLVNVYGYTPGSYPDHTAKTERLLAHACNRQKDRGNLYRAIVGDFNSDLSDSNTWMQLQRAGWIDAAQFVADQTKSEPDLTCKAATRPDRILL